MSNVAAALENLSPEQRVLFLRRLKKAAQTREKESIEPAADLSQRQIVKVPRDGEIPLSFAQERLWFLDQLDPASPVYCIPEYLLMSGQLDVWALATTVNEVVRRHEVLRTTFRARSGRPRQIITPELTVELPITDLSRLSSDRQESEQWRLLAGARRGFDLRHGPLLRVQLLKMAEEEHIFVFTIHHGVYDGWSTAIFAREIATIYQAFSNGRPSPLPELPVQYADYAHWQRRWLRGEVLEAQLTYWRQQLGGELPRLELPTDRPRPEIQSFRGEFATVILPDAVGGRLRALSRAEGGTLFMTLMAAFMTFLGRHAGQDDVIAGTPISGRVRPEIEGLIGCFVNILALRVDLSGNPSFRELLGRVRHEALGAYAHQDLPFERLLEDIKPPRDLSRTPVFQAFLNLLNFPFTNLEMNDLVFDYVHSPETPANFDLTAYIMELPDGIDLSLVYNPDLFDMARMDDMMAQFEEVLTQVAECPDTAIEHISLVTPQARLALKSAELPPAWPGSIPELVSRCTARVPEQCAVTDPEESWTYRELDQQSDRLAARLAECGVGTGDVVAIYAHRSAPLVWSVLGVLKTGAAFLILDPAYPSARLDEVLRLAEPAAWLRLAAAGEPPARVASRLAGLPAERRLTISARAGLAEAGALAETVLGEPPGVVSEPDDLAYLAFTSGSTGEPKGIRGGHRPLSHFVLWQTRTFELDESDRFSLLSGLAHDPLVRDLFTPLVSGATLSIPDPEALVSPGWLARWMARERLSVTHLTPAMAQLLTHTGSTSASEAVAASEADSAKGSLPCLRYAFFGGDVLFGRDLARLRELAPNATCVNFYGATETPQAMGSHVVPAGAPEPEQPVPLGRGIEGVELHVFSSSHAIVGIGELGEIHVRTPYLAHGYLGDPRLEAERFTPDPYGDGDRIYRTGDLGRYLPDGGVVFHGRADHQVKIRGFRIEPAEIEAVLRQHPAVREVAIVAHEDGPGTRHLIAYVSPDSAGALSAPDAQALRAWLDPRLPDYMLPGVFVFLEALPLTPNGKLDRAALPVPESVGVRAARDYVAPRTPMEMIVAEIFSEVLGIERVGTYDSFFELGGHSLLALQLLVRLRETLAVDLPLRRLFEAQTVAALAAVVVELQTSGTAPEAGETSSVMASLSELPRIVPDPANRYEPYPLTDLQQAYWLGHTSAFELGNISAHQYRELDFIELDLARLERAWQRLVEHHEVLRLKIRSDGRQQILAEAPPYHVEVDDLRGEEPAVVEQRLAATRARMADEGPPLSQWPLFELRASHIDDENLRLHLSTSLLITDGLSTRILARDLFYFYQDETQAPAPLELSHRDYVLALDSLRRSEPYRRALGYWRRRLAALPPAPELPLARSPASLPQSRFVRRRKQLGRDVWKRLQERTQRAGVSPTALLCTLYSEVLAAWSKERHFTLNMLFVNRLPLHPQVQDVVGNFSSTLPLEVHAGAEDPLVERARRLQAQLWKDLDHSLVTGVEIVRELNRIQGVPARLAMPVVFTSTLNLKDEFDEDLNPAQTTAGSGSLPAAQIAHATLQTPYVWLDHQVLELGGELILSWDAVEELFPPGMVDAMFDAYLGLILRLADDEETWQERCLNLVPAGQLARQAETNATGEANTVPSGLIHSGFHEAARREPERPALISTGRTVSYRQLQEAAWRIGSRLRESGVRPGQLVAVVMEKGWEQVVAVLGILESGAAYLPIDASLPAARIDHLLERGEVEWCLCQAKLESTLHWPPRVERLVVDETLLSQAPESSPAPMTHVRTPEDLAYVIFTSGSTGIPKGVMIEHRAALNTLADVNQRLSIGPGDRVLALSSLSFDLSVYDVFGLLAAGGAVVMPEPDAMREPMRWLELMREAEVTVWNTAPALMEMLVDSLESHGEELPRCLRLVMMSGDWIPVTLPERIRAVAPGPIEIVSLGGATEGSIWSILYPIAEVEAAWGSIPYGRPMLRQRFYVLDEDLETKPTWAPGHLYIAGAGLARGYWRDNATTQASFFDHPRTGERLYRTGDLGRYLPSGDIEFLGREDFQVKIQGYRIELGEIEATLLRHPAVRSAVVVAAGKDRGNRRLVGYVVPEPDQVLEMPQLDALLRRELPEYMVPRTLVVIDSLPLTANGKVDRGALPSPDETGSDQRVVPPRDDIELAVARIWEEILETESIGVTANFFALGGNSLMAVRLMARIRQGFDRELPLSVLFEGATIEHLASILRDGAARLERRALVAIRPQGSKRPFFCIHPVGGSVLCYVPLARRLDPERPFYGLQLPDAPGLTTIPEMAAHYLEQIRSVQPEGPYLLGGWSMGGVVAFELGRQLVRQGESLDALLLLDSEVPAGTDGDEPNDMAALVAWFAKDLAGLVGSSMRLAGDELRPLTDDERLGRLHEWATQVGALPSEVDLPRVRALFEVFAGNARALSAYHPEARLPAIACYWAENGRTGSDPTHGWGALSTDEVDVEILSGDHYTILQSPCVDDLASQLMTRLDRADASSRYGS